MDKKPIKKLERTRAHQQYKLADGTIVPGATGVLGVMDKSGPLMHWAWNLGMEGKDYRKTRDKAADIGTIAHFMVECHLTGFEPDLSEFSKDDIDKAENALIKFLYFWDSEELELVCSEHQIISSVKKYGGTLDLVARSKRFDGRLILIDFKTSKSFYDSHFYQAAGYRALWDGAPYPVKAIDETIIIRIGKEESGDFEARRVGAAAHLKDFAVFEACLNLFYAKRAAGRSRDRIS